MNISVEHGYILSLADRVTQQIEQRAARERPCRTLFVRNVQVLSSTWIQSDLNIKLTALVLSLSLSFKYEARQSDVMNMFSHFGEIKDIFDLIEQRGMVFVTFVRVYSSPKTKRKNKQLKHNNVI